MADAGSRQARFGVDAQLVPPPLDGRVSWWSWLARTAGILAAEVEKLAVYAGEKGRIERSDIMKLVGAGRVETIWKTLDAATTGEAKTALEHLDTLLAAGEQPTPMVAAMSASLLKIHHAGRLRAARINLDEACRIAGIPAFAASKTGKQHAHLGPKRVDQLPAMLLKADLDLKGGSMLDPRSILEILLVQLTLPRPTDPAAFSAAFFCVFGNRSTADGRINRWPEFIRDSQK